MNDVEAGATNKASASLATVDVANSISSTSRDAKPSVAGVELSSAPLAQRRMRRLLALAALALIVMISAGIATGVAVAIIHANRPLPSYSIWHVHVTSTEFAASQRQNTPQRFVAHLDASSPSSPRWHIVANLWNGQRVHTVHADGVRYTYLSSEADPTTKTHCMVEPQETTDSVVPGIRQAAATSSLLAALNGTGVVLDAVAEDTAPQPAWLFDVCMPDNTTRAASSSRAYLDGRVVRGRALTDRRELQSSGVFADFAVDLDLALRLVEHERLGASIHLILGTTSHAPGWALLTLDSFTVSDDWDHNWYDYTSDPDVTSEILVRSTEPSVPGYLSYGRTTVRDNTLRGSLDDRAIMLPLGADQIKLKLLDYDSLSSRDLIGKFVGSPFAQCGLSQMSVNGGCAFTFQLVREICGWWSCEDEVTATVSAHLYAAEAMEAKLLERNANSQVITEPWSPLLDPNDAESYWQYVSYYLDGIGYLFNGLFADDPNVPVSGIWAYRLQDAHSSDQIASGPGVDTTSLFSWNLSVVALKNLGPQLRSHDRFRRNELGVQNFNGVMWPEKHYQTIALGDDNADHARTRPLLDRMVGPAMAADTATRTTIATAATAALAGATLSTDATTLKVWTTKLLHRFHLGLDIDTADAEDFVSRMTPILAVASAPEAIAPSSSSMLAWKAGRLAMYERALGDKLPAEWPTFSPVEKTRVASTVLDSLLFAGGLSVPTVISNAFAVLYGAYGAEQLGADFELTEAQLLPFALEVVRRFPPVAGVPSWDRRSNHHTIVDVLMAAADKDAWGADAHSFVLRPMHTYHQKSIMWADPAIVEGDNGHPYSHACPAKDLSVMMVVEFLRAWLRRGGKACWRANEEPGDITISGYSASALSMTYVCDQPPPAPPCTAGATAACPQHAMATRTVACASAIDAMRVGGTALPEAMRGLFWLTNQGDSSALMSFAQSDDGGGFSPGTIAPVAGGGGRYEVRVGGDRVWSFMDRATSWRLVHVLDLVYQFDFDSTSAPTRAQITPAAPNLFGLELSAHSLLNFSMRLLPQGSHSLYANSVVWGRDTSVFNNDVPSAYYDLVQVVDASGTPLQPAFNDFVAFCASADAGSTPGEMHYHQVPAMPPAEERSHQWWRDLSASFSRAIDERFDLYGRTVSTVVSRTIASWSVPKATDVSVPTAMQQVPDRVIPLANVVVPETDEHWADIADILVVGQSALGSLAPFPDTGADAGEWAHGEDKIRELHHQLNGNWPEHRNLVPWGDDRFSDLALTHLVFYGVGQHRITPLGCAGCPSAPPSVGAAAKYAVLLGFAETLETRPGFARLGADAYFDRDGHVLAIVRGGTTWTPTSNPGSDPVCTGFLFSRHCTTNVGWQHAKLAFRGTLMAVVTFVDHLYMCHLSVGNAIVSANVEEVPPEHALRRLLTPFGFRTEAINFQSSFALIPEGQLVHRGSGLTSAGIAAVFAHAKASSEATTYAALRTRHTSPHVDTLTLPFKEDGDDFYSAVRTFVSEYLHVHYDYDAGACAADSAVVAWYARVNSMMPRHDLPPLTCENLEEVLATFMFYVSAMHNHVGTIAAEVEDPCFAPWAWREGELCGAPRTFFAQAVTMMSTSLEQPKIVEDYTHMFDDEPSKAAWRRFTASLRAVGARVDQRNAGRPRPFLSFATSRIETAISI